MSSSCTSYREHIGKFSSPIWTFILQVWKLVFCYGGMRVKAWPDEGSNICSFSLSTWWVDQSACCYGKSTCNSCCHELHRWVCLLTVITALGVFHWTLHNACTLFSLWKLSCFWRHQTVKSVQLLINTVLRRSTPPVKSYETENHRRCTRWTPSSPLQWNAAII